MFMYLMFHMGASKNKIILTYMFNILDIYANKIQNF